MQEMPKPNNLRSKTTGKLELRKLWSVPKAEFIYALFVEIETQECEMTSVSKDGKETTEPNWDKIVKSTIDWQTPQGYIGDEEWAHKTADHFEIAFPEEEWKGEDKE